MHAADFVQGDSCANKTITPNKWVACPDCRVPLTFDGDLFALEIVHVSE